ncbi:Prephenate dehydrogenase [Methanococcus vannielii SB]|uniref:Prephenate dehydrogenase n=1 Tax=Methanococcus vannielii (strain ATCC 35089 / DSM 1224 / JCM 13029 / OCM 148 / SB) TaxID=406327 RepID=A6UQG1_METVS|nr:prephenate dehydrogenase [Methanococcus vannielii]ABR54733.1 Prephenate dehydrogenase [Methanococcus vannielii SB]
MIISIIGGTDGLGKWFASFLKNKGFTVIVSGRDNIKGKEAEKELGVLYTSSNVEASKKGDIVIISVPINVTDSVIKEVAPHVKPGSLLMDITSIKEGPSKLMKEYSNEGVFILPSHPMFGPETPSLKRQVVILTPIEGEINPFFKKIRKFLENEGAKVIVVSPKEHDKIMGVVQGLTHFVYISLGSTLKDLEIDIKESRNFASPIYELMINIIARIIGQNPYLYADIQMHNSQIINIHEAFIKNCEKISKIVQEQDRDSFVENMKNSAEHFGNETKRGLNCSNKAVYAISRENEKLLKSIGKEVGLKHIYSENVHCGILKEVYSDYLVIKQNEKEIILNISNVSLMDDKDLKLWKDENLEKYFTDISVLFKKNIDLSIIIELLAHKFEIQVIDTYSGEKIDKNELSVTFRVYSFNKPELKVLRETFSFIIDNIGGKIRY